MADEASEESSIDQDSLLLLLRDAIVQHSSLNDIKLILRYIASIGTTWLIAFLR